MPDLPEKPFIPPTRKPVSEYPTPSPGVVIYTELVNRDDPAYTANAPVKRGSLYFSMVGAKQDVIDQYPNLYFLRERKFGNNDQLVFWDWATEPFAEDAYNAEINYVANAVPYPAFTRVYTIRRDVYDLSPTLEIGSILTALIGVNITSPGSGFTQAQGVIEGTDVDIQFVCAAGQLVSATIVNEGTGVTENSVIQIIGDGLDAEATPIVQPTNCYLTSQKKQELPDGDPLKNEFIRVLRTYETLPGPFIETTRIDEDGAVITVNTRRNIASRITSEETLVNGSWTHTNKKGDDNFVADEIVELRFIPGNNVASSRLDTDGVKVDIVTRLQDTTLIVTQETLSGGIWTRTTKERVTDLVSKEIIETRVIPGNDILETQINKDDDITSITRTLVQASTLATTHTIIGGVWTRTYEVPLNGSKLVATKTVEVRNTQNDLPFYSVEIPNLIPEKFRPYIPTETEEHTLIGTASLPTLGFQEFARSERQLDDYTYRLSITHIPAINLPVVLTNQETSNIYGGGVLFDVFVLELLGANPVDQGKTVVSSTITDLGIGLQVRESVGLHPSVPDWPVLVGNHTDERYAITINLAKQVVDAGTLGGASPDGSTIYEVKPHDKWRSIEIVSQIDLNTLPGDKQWFSGQRHSFPPELTDAIIEYAEATCGCVDKFTAVLQANMDQYTGFVKTRITEQFYFGPPPDDVTIDQFFPKAHVFGFAFASVCGCGSDTTSRVTAIAPQFRIPLCLHGDLNLNVGISFTWFFPATSPPSLPHGSYIMTPPHVERWRFGVFRRVLTEILVP